MENHDGSNPPRPSPMAATPLTFMQLHEINNDICREGRLYGQVYILGVEGQFWHVQVLMFLTSSKTLLDILQEEYILTSSAHL